MRNLALLLVFSVSSYGSQSSSSGPLEAPSIGVVYLLDSSDQTLKPLPYEAPKAKVGGFLLTPNLNTPNRIELLGGRSSFRIANNKPAFVFAIGNPKNASLYRFTQTTDNKRQFTLEKIRTAEVRAIRAFPLI
jgi:hypothetical protein